MKSVSTMGIGSLGRELDLETVVHELEKHLGDSVDANFSSNGMVTIRLEKGGPAFTLYRTGKYQVRGAKSEPTLRKSVDDFRHVLSEIDLGTPNFEFQHSTSVFLENVDKDLKLETLTNLLGMEETEYEPEQFPGLIYRPKQFDVTMLIFASGKLIISGTTDRNEAKRTVDHVMSVCNSA